MRQTARPRQAEQGRASLQGRRSSIWPSKISRHAKDLDPNLTNARLYLATAYANQYIPGAPSDENIRMGQQAIQEFQAVLRPGSQQSLGDRWYRLDPLQHGRHSLRCQEARRIEDAITRSTSRLKPDDPEPYYWIGVIDWSLAYRGNKDMREEYNKTAKKPIKDTDPMPPALATAVPAEIWRDRGRRASRTCRRRLSCRPDYDDAMAYLNLLYRQKADMETTADARDARSEAWRTIWWTR